ncbi:RNA polymerase sigma-70 factor [Pedobacter foliorum]|uniref:RNA polymerase sigma-70 factor n=1 Tax=Pedobacter foliorum TaxID=2739058 RepID=UPI001565113A|nr:RNA polymerase sigma-70 factor [Pedobacter foliorum]NRF41436.1 RNA polymerase sigma-70 factor [Pedobacter foliorum]
MDTTRNIPIDLAAFEQLFRTHHKRLCLLAMNWIGDSDVAEDIVQNFFITLWNNRETLSLKTSFNAYSYKAIKYSCIDYLRREAVQEKRKGLFSSEIEIEEEEEDIADRMKLYAQIIDVVDSLPADRKNVFLLHAVDRLSYAQIAEKLNISINTVKTQLRRAYMYLRDKLHLFLFLLLIIYG